ncbi:MAG TPA: sigma 54-interacting transcriptional regulator [Bacillaceae bacterium]
MREDYFTKEILETIIDLAYEWIVVVNDEAKIIYMNKNYCEFFGVTQEEVIGQDVRNVIENTRMHIVMETGKEEIADLHYIKGNYMIANRIPIMRNGKAIAAVGTVVFRDTNEWDQMNTRIKSILPKLKGLSDNWKDASGVKYNLHDIKSSSPQMNELKEMVKRIAPSDISILIRGESGTGKELFAHSIHQLSDRSDKPFIKVNCGAIPEQLFESELFGYEEGAFTGARKGGKKGKFQLAHTGTIFLDEIGDMPLSMQVKLLRVLQEKEIEPVGSVSPEPVDVRIIAATNRPLEKLIEEKRFREDLFYRINVIPFYVPPLRERLTDIQPLAEAIVEEVARISGKRISGIDHEVLGLFHEYSWPGNVRELENVIKAAAYLAPENMITVKSLPSYFKEDPRLFIGKKPLKNILEETEKSVLYKALMKFNGDKLKAAAALGLSKSTMYERISKYGLDKIH